MTDNTAPANMAKKKSHVISIANLKGQSTPCLFFILNHPTLDMKGILT